jgi:hypothetical protein
VKVLVDVNSQGLLYFATITAPIGAEITELDECIELTIGQTYGPMKR